MYATPNNEGYALQADSPPRPLAVSAAGLAEGASFQVPAHWRSTALSVVGLSQSPLPLDE